MKSLLLATSMTLATSSFAFSPYETTSVPHKDIDSYLVIGSEVTNTPKNLQGLWWMDGNPLADEVVSFAGATFEEIVEDGEVIGYSARIAVYDEGIWTWHDTFAGRVLYNLVLSSKLVYEAKFDVDFTYGEVTPKFKPLPLIPEISIPRSPFVDFTMSLVSDDEWSRDSVLVGQESSYRFRRIVDGEGNRLPAYDEYLEAIATRGPENALLPICKKDDGEVVPTACARD